MKGGERHAVRSPYFYARRNYKARLPGGYRGYNLHSC
jgi:hypothetical protein